jgi:hypothetical protein
MRLPLSLLTAFLLSLPALAQQHRGRVYDLLSGEGLPGVLITNTHSGALWLSDSSGNIAFTAYPGDVVRFSHKGYKDANITIAGYYDAPTLFLERAPIELKGVVVESPLAKYQRDTAFNRKFFRTELGYAHSQMKMDNIYGGPGFGIGVNGVFSELATIISGKRKHARKFERAMLELEAMQYSSIRYTPSLVTAQTGLTDTAAELFIVHHPISNEYLQAASELELKQHIRDMYREDLKADSLRRQEIQLKKQAEAADK